MKNEARQTCKCTNVHSLSDLCETCIADYERWLEESDLMLCQPITDEEVGVFRRSRAASPQGQAVHEYFETLKVKRG